MISMRATPRGYARAARRHLDRGRSADRRVAARGSNRSRRTAAAYGPSHVTGTSLVGATGRAVDGRRVEIVAAGTFGASEWGPGYPLQYNHLVGPAELRPGQSGVRGCGLRVKRSLSFRLLTKNAAQALANDGSHLVEVHKQAAVTDRRRLAVNRPYRFDHWSRSKITVRKCLHRDPLGRARMFDQMMANIADRRWTTTMQRRKLFQDPEEPIRDVVERFAVKPRLL